MTKISFFKAVLFSLTMVLFASCDKDFNEIGSDIIGEDHFGIYNGDISVLAYNRKLGAVQTNNLPVNLLGYYNNPDFGSTKASFLTQLELDNEDPTIGGEPQVTNVELAVPYFSTVDSTDSDGNRTYELDSIQGSGKIKLSVFESAFFLRDLDPATGFQQPQAYYSDLEVGTYSDANRLNDSISLDQSQNNEFYFNPAEIVTYELDDDGNQVVDERRKPELNLRLNKAFFQAKLFGASAAGNLTNNNAFKQYFRGLYFKVDNAASNPGGGSLSQINFKLGTITVKYTALTGRKDANGDLILGENGLPERGPKTLVLNMSGNTVNILENVEDIDYANGASNPNETLGDAKLYLKGGAGSSAVIKLFGTADAYSYNDIDDDPTTLGVQVIGSNGVADELDDIRNDNWLVNDATLTFFVDRDSLSAPEPNRVYLYDLDNKTPLLDYYSDVTTTNNPKFNKFVHGGLLEVLDADDRGVKYRVRLTNHIRNLLNRDTDTVTNVRLGLVVTENIGIIGVGKRKAQQSPLVSTDYVPYSSIMNPLGTVIFGSGPEAPADKRPKLEIYYTKPNL